MTENNWFLIICFATFSSIQAVDKTSECILPRTTKLTTMCMTGRARFMSCRRNLPNDSNVLFKCRESAYFKSSDPGYNKIKCVNGKWQPPYIEDFCKPICGIANKKELKAPFPWHATVYQKHNHGWREACTGSLISNSAVITVAHCFRFELRGSGGLMDMNKTEMKVAFGKNYQDFGDARDIRAQIYDIDDVVIHEEYNGYADNYKNDIAIVLLKRPVSFTSSVRPVCIDTELDNENLSGEAMMSGWNDSNELDTVTYSFIPRDECVEKSSPYITKYIASDKMCALREAEGKNRLCLGNSGGGLVAFNETSKSYFLQGILSVGEKECKENIPYLFSSVSRHRKFIKAILKPTEINYAK